MTIEEYLSYLKEDSSHKVYDEYGNQYSYDRTRGGIIMEYCDYGENEPMEDIFSDKEFKELNPKNFTLL